MGKPFDPENFPYTLVHDDLHESIKTLRGTSVKVLLFIMKSSRLDFTHFSPVQLSLNTITGGSGVSYNSVSPALAQLIEMDIVTRSITGHHPGTQCPLYTYSLNLEYETPTPEIGAAPTPKIGAATPEIGAAPETQTTVIICSDSESTDNIQEQYTAQYTDHDHEEDHVYDYSEKSLVACLRSIRCYQSHARKILERHGLLGAWQWYAYVINPDNNVDNPASYLWTAAISNGDPPPIPYREWEISEIERVCRQRLEQDQVVVNQPTQHAEKPADLDVIWSQALAELRQQMTAATYNEWLTGTQLESVDEGLALILTHNGYAKEWCDTRLRTTIERTLFAVAGARGYTVTDCKFDVREE